MKRTNEFIVGAVILIGLAVVIGGAIWLGQYRIAGQERIHTARFQTVGGLGVGAPVTLRGVRVGRVEAIRLAEDEWVEMDLRVNRAVDIPANPAVIAASASLFGEWAATIIGRDQPQDDPAIQTQLDEAAAPGGGVWPGATLPDIGKLTAQAGRIANDIALLTGRVGAIFDSSTVTELRSSIRDFVGIAEQLRRFTRGKMASFDSMTFDLSDGTADFAAAARNARLAAARIDSATADRQLADIMNSARGSSEDLRRATADFRSLMEAARAHEVSLTRVMVAADSIMSRLEAGSGTLGMLASDTTLYQEATITMRTLRDLLEDIQANPRRYFKFSVF
jgi:phospholipid/cholesterol/gamma-HCH transport system substrate-binding protein